MLKTYPRVICAILLSIPFLATICDAGAINNSHAFISDIDIPKDTAVRSLSKSKTLTLDSGSASSISAQSSSSTLTAQLNSSGSGMKEKVWEPGIDWQTITYNIDVDLELDVVFNAQRGDIFQYVIVELRGTVRFWGTAEDEFYGSHETWNFDDTRNYTVQNPPGGLLEYSQSKGCVTYVQSSFGTPTGDIKFHWIDYYGLAHPYSARLAIELPSLWSWFNNNDYIYDNCNPGMGVDLTDSVILSPRADVTYDAAKFQYNSAYPGNWRMVDLGAYVQADFELDTVPGSAKLIIDHLSSASSDPCCPGGGYSPVDIIVNGNYVESCYDPAENHGGSHSFVTDQWDIGAYLQSGNNSIRVQLCDSACSHYWIRYLYIDDLGDDCASCTLDTPVPIILVHGWRPGLNPQKTAVAAWDSLKPQLENAGYYNYYEFTYGFPKADGSPVDYARDLKEEVDDIIANTEYEGKFDIVCHSMGAMVSRYYMENLGGADRVRLWIGIAPVNGGAAILDHPIINLIRFSVPNILRTFFPDMKIEDPAVSHMETKSKTLEELNKDGISPNVTYKVIVGWNGLSRASYGGVHGKTFARKDDPDGSHQNYFTYQGDSIVAIEQSKLPGQFGIDCINDVNHNSILKSNETFTRVLTYLADPSGSSLNNWPTQPDPLLDNLVPGVGNRGYVFQLTPENIPFNVDSSVQKMTILIDWPGSDLDLQITSPNEEVLDPNVYPVVEYWKQDNTICYVIDSPTPGLWTVQLLPIDIPPEGEPYSLAVLYTSSISLELTTDEGTYEYDPNDVVTLRAEVKDANEPIIGATIHAEVKRPDMSIDEVALHDDGSYGDVIPNDGNYTGTYRLAGKGEYEIKAFGTGLISDEPFERIDIKVLYVTLREDLNSDDRVDFSDFAIIADQWLQSSGSPLGDIAPSPHGDGIVNELDLAVLAEHWLAGVE